MLTRSVLPLVPLLFGLSLQGCSGPTPKSDTGTKEDNPTKSASSSKVATPPKDEPPVLPEPDPLPPEVDLSGPTAPEVSTVFFSVEGAMIPMACFDHKSKKIKGGAVCSRLVSDGATVLLASESGQMLDTIDGKRNALCEVRDTPTSLSTPGLAAGNTYSYGVFPKSLGRSVSVVSSSSESDRATKTSDELRDRMFAAVQASNPRITKGQVRVSQRATHDIDGDGTPEEFLSVLVTRESNADKGLFSGLFQLAAEPKGAPILIEKGKGLDVIRLRGSLDLDGDGVRELWLGLAYDGGNADRLYVRNKGGGYDPIGKWTCGA
ncbi:MAG: hypothetical protein ACPHRO_02525 [Nannocystaceae bacterium]